MDEEIFKTSMDEMDAIKLAAGAMQLSEAVDYGPNMEVDASDRGVAHGLSDRYTIWSLGERL